MTTFDPDLTGDDLALLAGAGRVAPTPGLPERRTRSARRPRELTGTDLGSLVGSAISALCLLWLVSARLTAGIGWFGFLLLWFLAFLVTFGIVTHDRLGWLVAKDRLATVVIVAGGVVLLVPLCWLIGYVVVRGQVALRPSFFVQDQGGILPSLPATAGGGSHALVGTLEQVGLALLLSLPLGMATAVFLNESRSTWRRPVRIFVDAMSGLPSIVAGLFIFALFILPNAKSGNALFGYNGLMAGLALTMTMLPTVTRTVDVVLRLVPDGLREASLALGASRARTVWSVVIPTARTGITTAVVLGIARIVGETAPLLFTAFGYDLMNANPVSGSQESLPLFVFRNIRAPDQNSVDRGFAGALVLMILVLVLFSIARFIGRDRSRRRQTDRPRRPAGVLDVAVVDVDVATAKETP